jgi:sugar phosphate isomerase/epimerase
MTMEDFIVKAVELGVSGVDITTYWLKSTDPAYLVSLRSFAYRHGMPFSSLAIGADLCQPDSTKRAETLQTVFKWIDATQLLVPHTCGYLATNCRPARLPSKASEGWRKR